MDLIGGYGSDSGGSDAEDAGPEPVPQIRQLPRVSAAPAEPVREVSKPSFTSSLPKPSAVPAAAAEAKPKLVLPKSVLAGRDEDDASLLGPARPPPPKVDEKEIPSTQQAEVWSKLPAPKTKRVVQLQLPFNKALLSAKDLEDDDEDDKPVKKAKTAGKSKLMDFLPAPKNDLPPPGRIALGGGLGSGRAGTGLDLGGGSKGGAAGSSKGGAAAGAGKQQQQGQKPLVGATAEAFKVKYDDDSDDEDPMARYGAMPEAGAFAAGPAADEGEEVVPATGPSQAAGPAGPSGAGTAAQPYYDPAQYAEAAAYYVGADQAQYGADYQQQYDAAQYAQYYAQQQGQYAAAAPTGDPGQDLFQQALKEEAERAAKKGKGGADLLAGMQFKEVDASKLRYMDPAQQAAAANVRSALGVEYAAKLRAEAQSYEGNKMAKRKHQIGTLFYNAKMKELEILEGKASSMRHKSETQAKYGW